MRDTHKQAEEHYHNLRQASLTATHHMLRLDPTVRLTQITASALSASKKWDVEESRRVGWDWFEGYRSFSFRHPKRFEMAIWHDNSLMSLSLGRPTYHGAGLRLDFLEGAPGARKLRVFPIVFAAIRVYASALNAQEIRLVQPINETVRGYYEKFGFRYVKKGDYLYLPVERTT